jgi:hypothetical protein
MSVDEERMQRMVRHWVRSASARQWEIFVKKRHLIDSEGSNIHDRVLHIPRALECHPAMDVDDRSSLSPRLVLWQRLGAQLEHTEDP